VRFEVFTAVTMKNAVYYNVIHYGGKILKGFEVFTAVTMKSAVYWNVIHYVGKILKGFVGW
jgi:hypothetical protein